MDEVRSPQGYLPQPHFNLWTWVRAQVDRANYRPHAAPGIVASRLVEDDAPYYVLKNPRQGTYLKLSETDYTLWELMDGTRSVKDLIVAYFERYKAFAFGRVTALVDELRSGGFLTDKPVGVYRQALEQLEGRDWSHHWQQLARAFLEWEYDVPGVDRYVTFLYRLGGRHLFHIPVLGLLSLVALIGFGAFIVLLERKTFPILAPDDASVWGYLTGLLTLLGINLVMTVIHEMSHALTTKHFGREVRRGGLMIYYGMPACFVDTVDIWMEPKRRRIAVSWAGLHAELIVAGVCSLVAVWIADPASLLGALLFKAAFLGYLSLFVNLNPLLELDGYFILSDWLGIPMLRQRSFAFVRNELPGKLAALLGPRLRGFLPAGHRSNTPTPAAATWGRDEIIFTVFGGLAALYTVYTLIVVVYFWQTRISNMLLDLWSKEPALIFKPLVALLVLLVSVPVGLALGATLWNAGRRLADWLERRHFFERDRHVALTILAGLSVVLLAPILASGATRQTILAAGPPLLAGLAVWSLILTARQHAGAEFRATFWGLVLAAILLLTGSLLRGMHLGLTSARMPAALTGVALLLEQLGAAGLLVAGIRSLVGVDLRRGPTWERGIIIGLLALGFAAVLPVARWTSGWGLVEAIPAVASAYFTLVFLALIVPTLTAYAGTRFSVAWVTLALGAGIWGALNALRTAPTWPVGTTTDHWLQLAVAGLWGTGGLAYATAGGRLRFPGAHWSQDLTYSEEERLRLAFARFFETLFYSFRATFGTRRAQLVDDELDIRSVTAGWGVEIDAGRVRDELDLGQIDILRQADHYREVLSVAMDLVDNWAGRAWATRLAQIAYDSLPWPERETLGRYVLTGTPWGGAVADRFALDRGERDRLLRSVPFFAGLGQRDFYLLQAALESEKVPAGGIIARRGVPVRRFVLIQSGEIEIWQPDQDGKLEKLAGELRRGATIGAEVFTGQGNYPATYRASVDSHILTLAADQVTRLRQAGVEFDTHVAGRLATVQLLQAMPIFASLSPQHISLIAERMQSLHLEAGQVIIRQGEARHHFYVIIAGQVVVRVRDETGEEKIVAHLGPGEHLGETALYTDRPYAATCLAETAVELLALDEKTFDELVASSVPMAHYVEQVSTGRALDTRRKLVDGRR